MQTSTSRNATRRTPATRPSVEGLEDRFLLYAANGGHWQYPVRITYSFAPDGTNIGGIPSTMNVALNSEGISTAAWQQAVSKAALLWEATANINLVQVSDNGAAFGDPAGNQQGDSHYGDIRFGGIGGLSPGTLAEAFLPPPINGGSLAGDVVFNANQPWQVNADYDLQTVAEHEIGHALGLDHTTDSSAVMYPYYTGLNQNLAADDKAGIQSVYGPRRADMFDAAASNQTTATASDITPRINPDNLQISLPSLDISTNSDLDYYKVVVPAGAANSFTVKMQSTGLSSLSPRLYVLNGSGNLLTQVYSSSYGATVSATIGGVAPGQTYYFRAGGYNSGPQGVGAYGLQVNFGNAAQAAIAPPFTTVAAQPDQGGGGENDGTGPGDGGDKHNKHDKKQIGTISGYEDDYTVGAHRRVHRASTHAARAHAGSTASAHAVDHAVASWSPADLVHAKARHRAG